MVDEISWGDVVDKKLSNQKLMTKEELYDHFGVGLLSISEAAKLIGVSENTLREWDQNGKLPATRTDGGHRRYDLEKIRKYIDINPVVKKGSIEHEIASYRAMANTEVEKIYEKWNSNSIAVEGGSIGLNNNADFGHYWLPETLNKQHKIALAVLLENSQLCYNLVTNVNPTISLPDFLWLIRAGWCGSKLKHCISVQPMVGPTSLAYFKNKNDVIDSKGVLAHTSTFDFVLFSGVDFESCKDGYAWALANSFDNMIFELLCKKYGMNAEDIGTLNQSYDYAIVPEKFIPNIPVNHFKKIIPTHTVLDRETLKVRAVAGNYPKPDDYPLPIFMPYLINLGISANGFTTLMYRGGSLI